MIWNEAKECMSRDEIHHLQGKRLVKTVNHVYHNVEFYRKKMQAVGPRGSCSSWICILASSLIPPRIAC